MPLQRLELQPGAAAGGDHGAGAGIEPHQDLPAAPRGQNRTQPERSRALVGHYGDHPHRQHPPAGCGSPGGMGAWQALEDVALGEVLADVFDEGVEALLAHARRTDKPISGHVNAQQFGRAQAVGAEGRPSQQGIGRWVAQEFAQLVAGAQQGAAGRGEILGEDRHRLKGREAEGREVGAGGQAVGAQAVAVGVIGLGHDLGAAPPARHAALVGPGPEGVVEQAKPYIVAEGDLAGPERQGREFTHHPHGLKAGLGGDAGQHGQYRIVGQAAGGTVARFGRDLAALREPVRSIGRESHSNQPVHAIEALMRFDRAKLTNWLRIPAAGGDRPLSRTRAVLRASPRQRRGRSLRESPPAIPCRCLQQRPRVTPSPHPLPAARGEGLSART